MKSLKTAYRYWMKFARVAGRVNSAIILSLLFILLLGPYALVWKLAQLLVKRKHKESSFWLEKKYIPPTLDNLKRPF